MTSSVHDRRLTLRTYAGASDTLLRERFARDVRAGLTAGPKSLPCMYFYDEDGSRLFEEICLLPEYYLTRAEREILTTHAAELANRVARAPRVVELGCGNAEKTRLVLAALIARHGPLCYVPVDIATEMLVDTARALLAEYEDLTVEAVAGEYEDGLRLLAEPREDPCWVLWLGSNIGNLHRHEAAVFLGRIARAMGPEDRLLVGVDLRKDRSVLEPAYDDAAGVTARFNKNVLRRINRELGGHFDPAAFRHRSRYDDEAGRIEMYLDSAVTQSVRIDALDLTVTLAAGEPVHTEDSYKYGLAEIDALAVAAGLRLDAQWFDAARRFSVNLFGSRHEPSPASRWSSRA